MRTDLVTHLGICGGAFVISTITVFGLYEWNELGARWLPIPCWLGAGLFLIALGRWAGNRWFSKGLK